MNFTTGEDEIYLPPWPIWEDSAINSIKWSGTKKNWVFEDPIDHGVLPPSIQVSYWKRPDVNQDESEWTMAAEDPPVNLIKNNSHLMKYKIMSWIISSIHCLEELGRKKPFDVEYQSPSFQYNGGPNWKPWHHIYALTRAGKGANHVLHLNKSGMYVVRLFYLGSWRRIFVDDYLPYNDDGELLLPCTKNKYNLWSQILTKAILRLASLSWNSHDDLSDFSVISCLTGWIRFTMDCRSISIDDAWNVIQMHLVSKERGIEENKQFCLNTPSQTCLNESFKFYCSDNPKMRTIFASLEKTENELNRISPSEEHLICFMGAQVVIDSDTEKLPTWKKLRWIEWARKKDSKSSPGIMRRIISIYSPFRKRYTPNPYTEENIKNLANKIISGEVTSGLLKMHILNDLKDRNIQEEENEDNLLFRFSCMFAYIKELEIYFKPGNFQYSQDFTDFEKVHFSLNEKQDTRRTKASDKSRTTLASKRTSKFNTLSAKIAGPMLLGNYKMNCVYLYSISSHCKNFFFSLSVCKPSHLMNGDGYLVCEEYNWKLRIVGRLIFSLWTLGTRTHFVQLGNSVQVCRIWYKMPPEYFVSIKGNTPFEILNEESLYVKLSEYSGLFLAYGVNISRAFNQMGLAFLRSPEHYALINYFKSSFYPPIFDTLKEEYQAKLIDDFNEVFDECLSELVFEQLESLASSAACIEALRTLFNNEKLGISTIEKFSPEEKYEFEKCRIKAMKNQTKLYSSKIVDKFNEFNKEHEIDVNRNNEENLQANLKPKDFQEQLIEQSIQSVLINPDNIGIFEDSENCLILLRKIISRKKEYSYLYPFRNEHDLKMKFHEYSGNTFVTPLHNWFLITRLLVNVHSSTEVPCVILVKTSFPKVTLVVFENETCKQVLCPYDVNKIFYVSRRKGGYSILVYSYPTDEMMNVGTTIHWKIKIIGIDRGNILHPCFETPVLCKQCPSEPLGIDTQSITGFYFPNVDNVIGRFQIMSTTSPVVTLYISLSREDVKMRVVLRGRDKELCVAEGRGSVLIPVVLLDKSSAVSSAYDRDKCIFRGEIQLIGLWKLNKDERLFEENLRATSKKDVLSFDDFNDYSFENNNNDDVDEEEEIAEEEEFFEEFGESGSTSYATEQKSMTKKKTKKHITENFKVDSDEGSEGDFSINSENKVASPPPFGLLSYSPHWKISIILDEIDKEDTILQHDDQGWKTYEMFTKSWEENDPGRAERAERIRNEFLKFGKADFLKMQLYPDDLSLSDVSECSVNDMKKIAASTSIRSIKKKGTSSSQKKKRNREGSIKQNSAFKSDGRSRNGSKLQLDGYKRSAFNKHNSYKKMHRFFLTNDDYELRKEELRTGGHGSVSKPLAKKKYKKLPLFKCPPQISRYSSETLVSSDSGNLTEEEESSEISYFNVEVSDSTPKPSVIEPSLSLLANVPPQELTNPVSDLFEMYCSRLHERTVIEDKAAPKEKSITKALLKKYSIPSGNSELSSFNVDIFDFDLTPKKSKESLTYKDVLDKNKEKEDLKTFVEEVIEPNLWCISKQMIPPDMLETPPEFLKQIELGKAMEQTFIALKKEEDDHVSELQNQLVFDFKKIDEGKAKRVTIIKKSIGI